MFNKVRLKFILISIVSIIVALFLIVGGINVTNFVTTRKANDEIIDSLIENQENIRDETYLFPWSWTNPIQGEDETPHEIRYFTIRLIDDTYYYDLSHIVSVNQAKAEEYADTILAKNTSRGTMGKYRFGVNKGRNVVIVLDIQKKEESLHNFLLISILFSAIGLLLASAVIIFLSGIILKPVKESIEKQKQFITNASHELKTPLTIISANSELIEMQQGPNAYSTSIAKQVDKMNIMVKNLTALSKLTEYEKVETQQVNLTELAGKITASFNTLAKNSNKILHVNVEENLVIKSDSSLLNQFLSIILENAIKYSKSEIFLNIKKNKNIITIAEKNDVETKFEDGDLSYFTDRFYRAEEARSDKSGSGIGLSIANEISTLIKGKLSVFAKDGLYNIQLDLRVDN